MNEGMREISNWEPRLQQAYINGWKKQPIIIIAWCDKDYRMAYQLGQLDREVGIPADEACMEGAG